MTWKQGWCPGEVVVNGKVDSTKIWAGFEDGLFSVQPFCGDFGLVRSVGPYFYFALSLPALFRQAERNLLVGADGAKYRFGGARLGYITIHHSRMAYEVGEILRPISDVSMQLKMIDGAYRLELFGRSEPVDPETIEDKNPDLMEPYDYRIWFTIPSEAVSFVFRGYRYCDQISGRLNPVSRA